jgi:hypothetical protein
MGDAKAMEALKRSAGAEDDPSVRQHMEAAVEAIQFKQSSGGHTDG